MSNENQDRSKGRLPKLLLVSYALRRASYMVRGLAGAYLVYLMYQLFSESGRSEGQLTVPMIAAGAFMMVAGIYFVIGAAYALLNGIYAENDPAELEKAEPEAEQTETVTEQQESEAKETDSEDKAE